MWKAWILFQNDSLNKNELAYESSGKQRHKDQASALYEMLYN